MAFGRTGLALIALGATVKLFPRAAEDGSALGPGDAAGFAGAPEADAGGAGPPSAPPDPEARFSVEALLERGAPPEAFLGLGPPAVPVLVELASRAETPASRREKAIRVLGALPFPEAATPLRALISNERTPDEIRGQAALALAEHQGPAAVADLVPLLQDGRARIRLAAARALGQAGGDEARKALEDRLELEETAAVREAIQRTLTLMQP